jgi:site-specific recombinase XerD
MMATTAAPSVQEALTGFTLYLRAAGRADQTVKSYTAAVRAFAEWLVENGRPDDVSQVTRTDFRGFILALQERGLTAATARNRYASIRQFFKFLTSDGYLETDPTAGVTPPKIPNKPVAVLTDEQLSGLLRDAESGTDFISRRDAAILRVFVSTGARLSEVTGLRVHDLDLDRGRVWFGTTKGDKPREVGIGNKTARSLFRYVQARKHNHEADSEWLWLGRRGRFTSVGIAQMIGSRARSAGIDVHVHPHMLRHSYAHRHLVAGGEEGDLMRLLGWSDRSMLDRYAASTAQERALEAQKRLRLDDQF